jgi:hypothetical protein
MVITAEHVQNVCLPGKRNKTCSFLTTSGGGFQCSKGTPIEATIRQRLAAGTLKAKGDNCDGREGEVSAGEVFAFMEE